MSCVPAESSLAFILRAFSNGADGVYFGGCWPGECHYATEGNYHALSTVLLMKKILAHIGVNPERLRIEWVGASEGVRFAEVMNDVSKRIKELGPLGKAEGHGFKEAGVQTRRRERAAPLHEARGKRKAESAISRQKKNTENSIASDEFDRLFKELVADKLALSEIMLLLREGPRSAGEISEILRLEDF